MYQMINISNWILQHLFYIHITITYIPRCTAPLPVHWTGPERGMAAGWMLPSCPPTAGLPALLRSAAARRAWPRPARRPPSRAAGSTEGPEQAVAPRSCAARRLRPAAARVRGPCPTCAPHRCRRAALLRCRRRSGLPP